MTRKILWLMVSGLMVLSLIMTACGTTAPTAPTTPITPTTPATPTTPTVPTTPAETPGQKEAVSPDAPKYGGIINLVRNADPTAWDLFGERTGGTMTVTNPGLWIGDWAKGPAGGYGTNETGWNSTYLSDRFDHKTGYHAESTEWTFDADKGEGTIVYKIRRGIHWALDPNNEASRLVGGREVTADDIIFTFNLVTKDSRADLYYRNPELRTAEVTKTGPWEITVKVPLENLIVAISRFGDSMPIEPPEVVEKYNGMGNWRNSVGTGPFILTEYVAGSALTFKRNDNYWMTDPVGPGKGNQLPYLDGFRELIIPDPSTRLAAIRTGKVDQIFGLSWEDAAQMRKTTPQLKEAEGGESNVSGGASETFWNITKAPFNDVRVRRALFMATDFEGIRQSLGGGLGQILTFPYGDTKEYAELYMSLDDPDCPDSVKELYTYNPEKAKQLLVEAGYPGGFKTSVILTSPYVDYYAILKGMWAKVGVELELDVKESGVVNTIARDRAHEALIVAGGHGPVSIFYTGVSLRGDGTPNSSLIDDPVINDALDKIRLVALTDIIEAMKMMRDVTPYILDQAYVHGTPTAPVFHFWWPWLKNYSGEQSIGYGNTLLWAGWVWLDQDLKKSMGY